MASFDLEDILVRDLKEDECDQLLQMIIDLADFEKMAHKVLIKPEDLRQDIFSQPTRCHCLVAENLKLKEQGQSLVGYALYFPAYSTWLRMFYHLEDLYVKPAFRQRGIGRKLYTAFIQLTYDQGCARAELDVLDWNKPAKDFYLKVGNVDLTETEERHKMRMTREKMEKFLQM